jgi:hypothetical protein
MDAPLRIKTKIAEHEFDGEGPTEIVQSNFHAWMEVVKSSLTMREKSSEEKSDKSSQVNQLDKLPHLPIEKILKSEGRVVSLTAKADTVDEAVLLILLGQKDLRNNQEVTGSEIMDGLKQSGYQLSRVDRVTDKLTNDGDMITVGINRGRRYRLTNQGLAKSLNIAKEVIATVP